MTDREINTRADFQYRSFVYQWLKVLAIRFFIKKRGELIDNTPLERTLMMNILNY